LILPGQPAHLEDDKIDEIDEIPALYIPYQA
jgi:hypothetical protein